MEVIGTPDFKYLDMSEYLWQYSVPKATLPTFHAAMLIPWFTVALRQRAIFHYSMLLPQGNSCILTSFHYLMSTWIALNYKKKGGKGFQGGFLKVS